MMAVTLNVALLPAQTVLFCGCAVITGNWASFTVTVNEQEELFPQASVAVTFTVVVPSGNAKPLAGVLTIVTAPPQLSVAVGVKFTTAVQLPTGVVTVMLAGQVSTGAVWSFTVIICVQVLLFPHTSVALYVLVRVYLLGHV